MTRATASQVFAAARDDYGDVVGEHSTFTCLHASCRTFAVHHWGNVKELTLYGASNGNRRIGNQTLIATALCQACDRETIFVDGVLVYPLESEAPAPPPDLPNELLADFEEARRVLSVSPRGAAALLRLLVQKLLPMIGATPGDINRMIGQLVAAGTVNPKIQQALDSVRVIGNEAVHPGTMDLKDDAKTALSLFKLVNYIVERAITEPKEIDEIYSGLPAVKLAGIAQRDSTV